MDQASALRARLNGETARVTWPELERLFASGRVLSVAAGADLVEVAARVAEDDRAWVAASLEDGTIAQVSDREAARWADDQGELWAVVVRPWVLVQDLDPR